MAERTLILLRHAKSDWSGTEPDIARSLAPRGLRQAPDVGRWLAGAFASIDLAVVSPAERARSTWDLVSAELDSPPPRVIEDGIYAASVDDLLEVVHALPDDAATVVLVGHNPGLEELVLRLTGEAVPMPTSGVAVITWAGSWSAAGEAAGALSAAGRPPASTQP